jgi:predicted Zn-dependent protease
MKRSALHQERFEAIERYLLGTMNDEERRRFEQEMAGDEDLRAEVALQRENMLAVELGGLQETLRTIAREEATNERSGGTAWPGFLKYAAAAVLLLGVGLWWLARPADNERLFAEHFSPDPGLPVPMSISNDPVFHDAMVAYKLGDYQEARTKWATLLPSRPANDTLRYYMGSAALAAGDPAQAVPLLQAVAGDSASVFNRKARWYIFLSCLRTGDTAGMNAVGLDDDPLYGERVRAIKSSLR